MRSRTLFDNSKTYKYLPSSQGLPIERLDRLVARTDKKQPTSASLRFVQHQDGIEASVEATERD